MFQSLFKKLRINQLIDQFRKGNLRVRYVTALLIIAVLSISLQIIVQYNLHVQKVGFETIRSSRQHIDRLRSENENLLEIATVANQNSVKDKYNLISKKIINLLENDFTIWSDKELVKKESQFNLNQKELTTLSSISHQINKLFSIPVSEHEERIEIIFSTNRLLDRYLSLANEELARYNKQLSKNLDRFRVFEIIILFSTLGVLFFEAFYIFTPAIKKLDESLKNRSDFFSRISHEIRNPMNSILGMADLIEKLNLNETQRFYNQRLKQSAEGLLFFLNNVIEFAGIENHKVSVQISNVNLKNLINEIISLTFIEAGKKNLNYYIFIDPELPYFIQSDYIKIKHIITNLLGNAIKFTKYGHISISFKAQKKRLILVIKDTGLGISKDKQEHIFQEFVQEDSSVKRKYGGTGLGLTIVKEYLNLLDGDIKLESQKGEGTIFTVSIPFKEPSNRKIYDFKPFDGVYSSNNSELKKWVLEHTAKEILSLSEFKKDTSRRIVFLKDYSEIRELDIQEKDQVFINQMPIKTPYSNIKFIYPMTIWPIEIEDDQSNQKSDTPFRALALEDPILICDDSADNRIILESLLKPHFKHIEVVTSGGECVEILKHTHFKYIFLDIQMPKIDGFSVISQSKNNEACQGSTFIAYTAHNSHDEKTKMKSFGFKHFLNKPVRTRDIQKLFEKLNLSEVSQKASDEKLDSLEERIKAKIMKKKGLFVEDKLGQIESIPEGKIEENLEKISNIAHQIKGSAANFGFEDLQNLGAELEKTSKNGELEQTKKLFKEVKDYLYAQQ